MVITTRVLLGAAAVACLLQSLSGSSLGLPPPSGLTEADIEAQVLQAVDTLQSQANYLIDQLHQKYSDYVTRNGDPIKEVLLELKAEEESFIETQNEMEPKYANCSGDQVAAVKLAIFRAEVQLIGECSALQYSALNMAVQQMLSFYTSDKSLIFAPCLPTSALPTDEQLSQAGECIAANLAQATDGLTASEAAMEDTLHAATVKDNDGTTSCVDASRVPIGQAAEALSADLELCMDEIDQQVPSVMMRGRWKKVLRWVCTPTCWYYTGYIWHCDTVCRFVFK